MIIVAIIFLIMFWQKINASNYASWWILLWQMTRLLIHSYNTNSITVKGQIIYPTFKV